jgi:WD40 repeat protein
MRAFTSRPAAWTSLILATLCTLPVALSCRRAQPEPERIRVVPQVAPRQPRRVQFHPQDGDRLLIMEATGLVSVWNVADPSRPVLFASMPASAIDACFSPDGQAVATVGIDGYVRWWGIDGELRWTSNGRHEGAARAIAVRDGMIVSGGEDGKLRLWNPDGEPAGEPLAAHQGWVLSVGVSAAGDLVSLGTDESIRVWRRSGGGYQPSVLHRESEPKHVNLLPSLLRLDVHWGWDHAVEFSPRGDAVAGALFDGAVRFWNEDGTERAAVRTSHAGHHVRAVTFSPNGEFVASAGFDGRLRLWNPDGGARLVINDAHRGPALSVAVSPAGDRLASAGSDEAVRLWGANGKRLAEFPRSHGNQIRAVAFAPEAPLLAASEGGGSTQVWNLDGSPHGAPLLGHKGAVLALAFSPRGDRLVTGGKDATVRVWRLDGKAHGAPLAGHVNGVFSVAFAAGGEVVASGGRNDRIRLWSLEGKPFRELGGLRDIVGSIAFSPRGDVLAAGDAPGGIMLWNADGSVRANVFKAHRGFLHSLAFSPSAESLASAGADGLVKLWSIDGKELGPPLVGHVGPVHSVAFSADGEVLASGGVDGTVRLWSLPTRQARLLFVGLPVNQVGFHGSRLWVRANGQTIYFFDQNLEPTATMLLRRDAALVFTPNGWFSGPPRVRRAVKLFRASGQPLTDSDVATRMSAERVLAAVRGE